MGAGYAVILFLSTLGLGNPSGQGFAMPPLVVDAPVEGVALAGGCGGSGAGFHAWVHCVNDLPQHFPYENPVKGYYFFRPYNYTMIPAQQQAAGALGLNPQQPYDNRFFQRLYEEFEGKPIPTATTVPQPPVPLPPPPVPPDY